MIEVTLYSREDCHLCDQTLADLESLQETIPHKIEVIDVDSDASLHKKYGFEVPVVVVGPYTLRAPISLTELEMTLGAARDREQHIVMVEKSPALEEIRRKAIWTKADDFSYWISRHYMFAVNLFVLIYVGLPFLAPVLMRVGAETPANLIYRSYSFVCHQLAFRSFFLFGEQIVYPREIAGVERLASFGQVTGLSEGTEAKSILQAQRFVGDPHMGYKVALCERDVAIYVGILLFGIVFSLTRRRIPALPWYLWLILGILPIALDGGSQLVSQLPLIQSVIPIRESTPFLRILTGALFGIATAWFGFPMVEESMSISSEYLATKWKHTHQVSG